MALDGCGIACKYVLILFNIIFAVVGFAFLILGMWLRFSNETRGLFEIPSLNSSAFVTGVTILIALGSVMLIVVVFGDYGVCNEKRCALQVFSVLLALLATAEIVCGVLAYSRRYEVGLNFAQFYTSMYLLYAKNGGDPAIGVSLTFIHYMLHCCGVTGVPLMELAKQTCPKPDGIWEHLIMPNCPEVIVTIFDSKASLVMGIFIGTAALLVLVLICSITLSRKIHLSVSSPQYIVLTNCTPGLSNPQPSQHEIVSTSYSYPNQDPVMFTPLTMANVPVGQA
ncbi:putative CD9 antigen-like isoform 2 [Scophthalmus maximus]|uniref:Tetraspanin n=1 Tax=Scophthalmus maximus TaxID=52904 RepID=A0A2U9CPG8_SCOMX|nr:CD9 antigen isoform X1 [Scophthalmus maximus]XP_035470127.1 CD9 antigen isoform X1 [Scophthalmus maximus]AWP18533.1 putative CD9 antigen-like [Scophthalmus maximus]AWP18534.1 putative CD9 antigen-like isoform 2 [Scophthalmus maximus]